MSPAPENRHRWTCPECSRSAAPSTGLDAAICKVGGDFPGSSVVHWAAGADGRGVLLVSDTIHANPDRATVTFLRSYPNRIPLSPAAVERITRAVTRLQFDRVYDNFGTSIDAGAAAAVSRSADRYCGWVRGDFDRLT